MNGKKESVHYQSGFTLIELIIAISILAILATAGVASLVTYSRKETIVTAYQDVLSSFNEAKLTAASQVKPNDASCISQPLDGYQIEISAQNSYKLEAVCGGNIAVVETKTLPANVIFSLSPATFIFTVIKGTVESTSPLPVNLTIKYDPSKINYSYSKTISIYKDGRLVGN